MPLLSSSRLRNSGGIASLFSRYFKANAWRGSDWCTTGGMLQAYAIICGIFNSRTEAPAFSAAFAANFSASAPSLSGTPAKSCVTTPILGFASGPANSSGRLLIADRPTATSSTLAANTPTVSSDQEKHLTPTVGSSRNDGLIAASPQNEAGPVTEPEDEPPGVCSVLCGLSVAVGSLAANAVVVVLPAIVAPACFSIITTEAS